MESLRGRLGLDATAAELGISIGQLRREGAVVEERLMASSAIEPECTRQITVGRAVAELRAVLGDAETAKRSPEEEVHR